MKIKDLLKTKRPQIKKGKIWRVVVIVFLVSFVIISFLNALLFYGFHENMAAKAETSDFPEKAVNFKLLDEISRNVFEKEVAFEKYKYEIPNVIDPSL